MLYRFLNDSLVLWPGSTLKSKITSVTIKKKGFTQLIKNKRGNDGFTTATSFYMLEFLSSSLISVFARISPHRIKIHNSSWFIRDIQYVHYGRYKDSLNREYSCGHCISVICVFLQELLGMTSSIWDKPPDWLVQHEDSLIGQPLYCILN